MKKRIKILYFYVMVLFLFQLVTFIFVSIQFSKIQTELSVKFNDLDTNVDQLDNVLGSYQSSSQKNFNDISILLAQQAEKQKDFEDEISVLQSPSDLSEIIEDKIDGVVSVFTEDSAGSGFIINSEGYIVTNHHVIADGQKINVLTHDRKFLPAKLIGSDSLRDLALLKIEGTFDYLELADSSELKVGNKVIAIGNPLGLSFTVTEGIVSAIDREGPNGLNEYIQTDVSLNPGNSGGPLIDSKGEVVGINNFKVGDAESLGFALESDSIKESINNIVEGVI